jgi:hypothetical protein
MPDDGGSVGLSREGAKMAKVKMVSTLRHLRPFAGNNSGVVQMSHFHSDGCFDSAPVAT